MSEEVYTVEQFAERLKLHPKTVLRFIREGRLRAMKVGRGYRILRSDLEAMTGVRPSSAPRARLRVTSVVDVPGLDAESAQRLSRQLTAARTASQAHAEPMSLDIAHDPIERRVKVILVGSPADTAAMLQLLDAFAGAPP